MHKELADGFTSSISKNYQSLPTAQRDYLSGY